MSLLVDDDDRYPEVQWDTPISNLIRDDFVLEDDHATTHTTIEDILSHRTGMPRHDSSYGGTYDGHEGTPRDYVRALRYLPLSAELRTRYQYCNMMYVTAAYVIETLTGFWLGDLLRERIWKPLEMKSTVCGLRLSALWSFYIRKQQTGKTLIVPSSFGQVQISALERY